MEENSRPTNNEEENIFYEYFSQFQRKEYIDITELDKHIEKLHSNTLKAFANIIELTNVYVDTYERSNREISYTDIQVYCKTLYDILSENNIFQIYINCIINELTFYESFLNGYKITQYSRFAILLRRIKIVTLFLRNKQNTQFLGFNFLFCTINLVDHFFNIIPLVVKKNHKSIYKKGCIVLKLSITKFVDIALSSVREIYNIINGNFSGLAIDVANIVNAYNSSQSFKFTNNYVDKNNSNLILKIQKYLTIADFAYNNSSSKIPNDYFPITNSPILDTNKNGHFKLGMMYACLLRCKTSDEIILGFSGTDWKHGFIKCLNTVLTDVSQLCDVSTSYIYAVGAVAQIKEEYPQMQITLCGHSLGGGLAQFAAATQKGAVKVYCFNSAGLVGAYNIIKTLLPINNIYHYRLENDIISRIGELIGNVNTIKYSKSCHKSHGVEAIKDAIKNL